MLNFTLTLNQNNYIYIYIYFPLVDMKASGFDVLMFTLFSKRQKVNKIYLLQIKLHNRLSSRRKKPDTFRCKGRESFSFTSFRGWCIIRCKIKAGLVKHSLKWQLRKNAEIL